MRQSRLFLLIVSIVSIVFFLIDLSKIVAISDKKFVFAPLQLEINPKKILENISSIDFDMGGVSVKKKLEYKLGLDLQGGVSLSYDLDMKEIPEAERSNAVESARNILDRRINFFGVTEPTIQTVRKGSDYRIVVELPGVSDAGAATELIGRTAQLTFWEVGEREATESGSLSNTLPFGILQVTGGKEPIRTKLAGNGIKKAQVVYNPTTGEPEVQIEFTEQGTKLFADITKRNVQKALIIVLDNEIVSWPIVQQAILNGNTVIQGRFSIEQAKNLSTLLNAGALPVPLKLVAQTTIGPSLGIESLKKSLFAGIVGLFSIAVFITFLYKKEGVLACFALIIYSLIVLFVFKLIPVTLTLAGVAGFILSVGMAIDANILIFERMKEELRAGRARDIAIEIGFKRAWSSIRDSNISSLITCFILFYLGTGIVRGFALTLAIGILVSMFTAIIVTRNLLRVLDK